jgi:hypothetical protein
MAININGTGSISGLSSISSPSIDGVPVGSASAPAFSFTGDPNTGIYSPGADQVAISTNSSGRLFIDANGNVGINTASTIAPGGFGYAREFALTGATSGDSSTSVNLRGSRTVSGGFADINFWHQSTANRAYIQARRGSSDSAIDLDFITSGGAGMRITSGGLVGIGTTVANSKLSIGNGVSTNDGLTITFTGDNSTLARFYASTSTGEVSIGGIAASYFPTFYAAGSEKARIDTSGRLLVGTSTSASAGNAQYALLQVRGNSFSTANNAILNIGRGEAAASITSGEDIGNITFTDSSGNEFAEIKCTADANAGSSDYPGRLVFSTTADGASSPTEWMRITSNGSVIQNYYVFDSYNAAGFITGTGKYIGSSNAPGIGLAYRGASNANAGVISFGGLSTNGNAKTLAAIIVTQDNTATNRANGYLRFYTNRDGATDASATPIERVRFTDRILCDVTTITSLTSERRLKQDIDSAPLNPELSWDVARDLPIRSFAYKNNPESTNYGYIVDEVEAVDPSLVFDTGETDDEGVIRSYDNAKLQAMYHLALKQALVKIEALEAKVAALETP